MSFNTAGIFDAILGSGLTLRNCDAASRSPNVQSTVSRRSGEVAPNDHFVDRIEEQLSWTTMDLSNVLSGISLTGGTRVDDAQIATRSRVGSSYGTNVVIHTADKLHATVSAINCPATGSVNATVNGLPISTQIATLVAGLQPPLVRSSIVAPASTSGSQYKLLSVTVNGVALDLPTNVTINTGVTPTSIFDAGKPYPVECEVRQTEPNFDVTFESLDSLYAANVDPFAPVTSASVVVAQRVSGGTIDPASLRTFSIADGIAELASAGGSSTNPVAPSLRVRGEVLSVA